MIGLTADKLVLIAVLVGFLFGPERLPHLAERLGRAVRTFRDHLTDTEHRMRTELGVDLDVEHWRKLDPRRYDPRTIVRDALTHDASAGEATLNSSHDNAAAVKDHFVDSDQDASNGFQDSPEQAAAAEPDITPMFRRRSDGHLEAVPVVEASE